MPGAIAERLKAWHETPRFAPLHLHSDRRDRTCTGGQDGGFHLGLLAEDINGWNNLMRRASEAYLTGFYFKPRMDRELLEACSDGLIAIDGHLGSEIAHHLVKYEATKDEAHWKAACDVCAWKRATFSPNADGEPRFYVELQHHVPEQIAINPHLLRLARVHRDGQEQV